MNKENAEKENEILMNAIYTKAFDEIYINSKLIQLCVFANKSLLFHFRLLTTQDIFT